MTLWTVHLILFGLIWAIIWEPLLLESLSIDWYSLGRWHSLFVHLTVTFLFVLPVWHFVKQSALPALFRHLILVTTEIAVVSGLVNSFGVLDQTVNQHTWGAMVFLHAFLLYTVMPLPVTAVLAVLAGIVTAHFGGLLHFGYDFFHFDSNIISKSHYFLIFAVFPLLLAARLSNSAVLKRALVGVSVLALLSGCHLYWNNPSMTWNSIIHVILGTLTLITVIWSVFNRILFYPSGILIAGTIAVGIVAHYGEHYFSSYLYQPVAVEDRDFHQAIGPLIQRRCVRCHNEDLQLGGIRLDSLESLMTAKTDSFNFIEPQHPMKSAFFLVVARPAFLENHMPYLKGQISPEERQKIAQWIGHGGPKTSWASLPKIARNVDFEHWSQDRSYPVEFDGFAGLDENYRWLLNNRKVDAEFSSLPAENVEKKRYLSLTGFLPGSLGHRGWSTDDLIETKYFNENMSLLWFDLSSFGETSGFESFEEVKYSDIYKKHVFQQFQTDQNYLKFLADQVQRSNIEDQLSFFRYQPVYGKIETVTAQTAMENLMALSVGQKLRCARCHDHKYAPVGHEEYYEQLQVFQEVYPNMDLSQENFRLVKGEYPKPLNLSLYEGVERNQPIDEWLTNVEIGMGFYTARTYVDSVIQHFFGKSILKDPMNIYNVADKPKLLPILNWLTADFIHNDGSTKSLVKKLVDSQVFASSVEVEDDYQLTEKRRLRVENIRNNLLALAGRLSFTMDQPVKEPPPEVRGIMLGQIVEGDQNWRSVMIRRRRLSQSHDALAQSLDLPDGHQAVSGRPVTSEFKEVVFFLGDSYFGELIPYWRKRYPITGYDPEQLNRVYQDFYGRKMSQNEQNHWREFFSADEAETRAEMFFHLLVSRPEFIYY